MTGDVPATNGGIRFAKLADRIGPWSEKLEDQRRNIGASFALGNKIRTLAKRGIAAIKREEIAAILEISKEIRAAFVELSVLDIPADMGWSFDSENGQELVEFLLVAEFYPYLAGLQSIESLSDMELSRFSDPPHGLSPQAWLSGLCDVPGELGKIHLDMLCDEDLSLRGRVELRKRWLLIADYIYQFLDNFECAYPLVINASRRRGFFNTFRGKLVGISRLIETNRADLAREIAGLKLAEVLERKPPDAFATGVL